MCDARVVKVFETLMRDCQILGWSFIKNHENSWTHFCFVNRPNTPCLCEDIAIEDTEFFETVEAAGIFFRGVLAGKRS